VNQLLLIAGMSIATMATRIPVLLWFSRRKMPEGILRALRYVPPAVLAAIIAPAILMPAGQLALGLDNAAIPASLVAIFISWRTRNLLLTIIVGMAVFFFIRTFI
jgi:branched-subunit amino acid transport protein